MGGVMEVVVEDGWDNHNDNNINQSERERRPELKPDWHEVKWWEELGIVMSQFHMGVRMEHGHANWWHHSGLWEWLHAQWWQTPRQHDSPPPPSPKFNHLPLMGTLHREDRKEEEERRQGISNNFSFSFSLDLS